MLKTIDEPIYEEIRVKLLQDPKFNVLDFLRGTDVSVRVLLIITVSTSILRKSLGEDTDIFQELLWFIELIESARHRKFINMIQTALD